MTEQQKPNPPDAAPRGPATQHAHVLASFDEPDEEASQPPVAHLREPSA